MFPTSPLTFFLKIVIITWKSPFSLVRLSSQAWCSNCFSTVLMWCRRYEWTWFMQPGCRAVLRVTLKQTSAHVISWVVELRRWGNTALRSSGSASIEWLAAGSMSQSLSWSKPDISIGRAVALRGIFTVDTSACFMDERRLIPDLVHLITGAGMLLTYRL